MSATNKNAGSQPRLASTFKPSHRLSFLFLILILFGPIKILAGNNVLLKWTAPGDDKNIGRATCYDLRYSAVPIGSDTANWWEYAQQVKQVPYPSRAGNIDSCIAIDLPIDRTHYFAIKTADEVFNWSDISNIVEAPPVYCIDINLDKSTNILDAIYLLNLLYKDGPEPPVGVNGDVNHSGEIDILDPVFIINFCYKFGPPPDCGN